MRRIAPRGLDTALASLVPELRPDTTLALVQEVWPQVVGDVLASEALPVSERRGTVSVSCRSAVWAQELQLLSGELVDRLNNSLAEGGGEVRVAALRFLTGEPSPRTRRR